MTAVSTPGTDAGSLLCDLEEYAEVLEKALRECRRVGDGESEAVLRDGAAMVAHELRRVVARAAGRP